MSSPTDRTAQESTPGPAPATQSGARPGVPTAGASDAAATIPLTHRQILVVLSGLMLGMLVAALSQTIVATALPTIVGELGGQDKLAWIVSATLLTSTASTPIWGKLSDLYGRKGMFQTSIAIFLVASLGSGFAQNIWQLIGFRALQGLGVGGLQALSQAILGDVVAPRERGRYQGYMGGVFGLATVAGPLIGGFLVDNLSWRWTFWVGIPIGLAALIVTERVLRLPFKRTKHQVDWLGAFYIVAAVSSLLVVLSFGGKEFAWASAQTYALSVAALVFLVLAVFQERRAAEPIMPPHLFRNHTFVITSLGGFIVGVAMFGATIYVPQYLQIVKLESPTASGLLTLPMMVGMLTMSIGSGRRITTTGRYKRYPIMGLAILAVGLYLLSRLKLETSLVIMGASIFVVGLGMGLVMQVLVLAVQNSVDRRDLGVATSGSTFFRSMGGAVGVSVFGALLSARITTTIPARFAAAGVPMPSPGGPLGSQLGTPAAIRALPDAISVPLRAGYADALHTVFLVGIPIVLLGWVVMWFLREIPLRQAVKAVTPRQPGDGQPTTTALGVGGVATQEEPSPDPRRQTGQYDEGHVGPASSR